MSRCTTLDPHGPSSTLRLPCCQCLPTPGPSPLSALALTCPPTRLQDRLPPISLSTTGPKPALKSQPNSCVWTTPGLLSGDEISSQGPDTIFRLGDEILSPSCLRHPDTKFGNFFVFRPLLGLTRVLSQPTSSFLDLQSICPVFFSVADLH